MTITTVGIDLAKNVFAVHCVDQHGKTVLVKPKVSRAALPELIASLPPCYRDGGMLRGSLLGKVVSAIWS
jgi:transposase